MKLAFCLFKYFPFGGLQRDFLKIASACRDQGHEVEVFVAHWQGEIPNQFKVNRLSVSGLTNHRRAAVFAEKIKQVTGDRFDVVIGFNKMSGLDLYFAADPCYLQRAKETRSRFYRLSRRFQTYVALERAVFSPESETRIIVLSEREKRHYIAAYGTAEKRFHLLPPGIDRNRRAPENIEEIRSELRRALHVGPDELMVLMVGSGYRTKGLDRSIKALAALPPGLRKRTKLFVIGEGSPKAFMKLAGALGVKQQVTILGGREDVPRFLFGADILLHPAYTEAYGMVLIEALAAGLPVLTTDVCGYAYHIEKAGAGCILPSPFSQRAMNCMLEHMLSSSLDEWRQNGLAYAAQTDFFSLSEKAVALIEQVARQRLDHA